MESTVNQINPSQKLPQYKSVFILHIIVNILLLILASFFYWQNRNLTEQLDTLTSIKNEPVAEPTPQSNLMLKPATETSAKSANGWYIYENEDDNFTFQYPQEATLTEEDWTPRYIVASKVEKPGDPPLYSFRIGEIAPAENISFDDYAKTYYEGAKTHAGRVGKCGTESRLTQLTKTSLSNQEAYFFQQIDCRSTNSEIYLVNYQGGIYYVGASASGSDRITNIEIAKMILKTLQFTEPE